MNSIVSEIELSPPSAVTHLMNNCTVQNMRIISIKPGTVKLQHDDHGGFFFSASLTDDQRS